MKKFLVKQMLIYPTIFSIAWFQLFKRGPDSIIIDIVFDGLNGSALDFIPIDFTDTQMIVLFGFLFGHIYGTISSVVKVRSFRGIIFAILFFIKTISSMLVVLTFGPVLFLTELVLLPIAASIMKKRRPIFIKKKRNEKSKEEIIAQIEALVQEYKKA